MLATAWPSVCSRFEHLGSRKLRPVGNGLRIPVELPKGSLFVLSLKYLFFGILAGPDCLKNSPPGVWEYKMRESNEGGPYLQTRSAPNRQPCNTRLGPCCGTTTRSPVCDDCRLPSFTGDGRRGKYKFSLAVMRGGFLPNCQTAKLKWEYIGRYPHQDPHGC